MTEKRSKTQVAGESLAERNCKPWLVVGGLVGLAVVTGVFFAMRQSESEPVGENSVAVDPAAEAVEEVFEAIVDDDGRSLWVSPTAGAPISLSYLPQGTQLVLHVRPAELLAHAEGEKVLAALGPWGEEAVAHLERQTGVPLADVEALAVAVHATLRGELHTTWRLQLAKPPSDWQSSAAVGERVCFFPAAERGKVLVSCLAEDVAELMEQGDAPALFPRDMQQLFDRTDDSRMATLVFPPRFLQTDGHKLLAGGAKQLEIVLAEMAGTTATAVALSAHWDENFFLELQSTVTLDLPPHRFGSNVQRWLPHAVDALESAIRTDPGHPYGRKIIERFPAMLRTMSKYTRSEEVDGVSVLRCYLPSVAGHNLLMAAELVLNQSESSVVGEDTAHSAQAGGTETASPEAFLPQSAQE